MRLVPLALMALMVIPFLMRGSDAAPSAKATLTGTEFTVSVDPSDPRQGILEVQGKVSPAITEVRDKLTVTLSSNITEMDDGGKTGRYWHSVASFDGATQSPSKIFKKGDPPAGFTVTLDPSRCDPQTTKDIPVPGGISPLTWGKLVLTARYTGSSEGSSTDDARIYPEPFYLVNLSLNSKDRNMSAGDVLNFTFTVKNPSNQEEGIILEMPAMEILYYEGWNVTASGADIPLLAPGEERDVGIRIVAPDEIVYSDSFLFEVTASTTEIDPDTGEPGSVASSSFTIFALESKVGGNDKIIDGQDEKREGPSVEQVLTGIGVLVLVVISLIVLVLFVMKGRGGGKDGSRYEGEASAPVRM